MYNQLAMTLFCDCSIMCSKDLCPEVKRPFVRYLIHVYMYTNGERDSQEEAILAHGE